ncbi:MAG: protein translocase subunit SecF [Ignavibacteriales bacterium]|nr:protein translocase subunit SecF [Ignavibacteriales bacterium]
MTSKGQKLEIGWRTRFFDNLNFDFLSKRKLAYTISTIFAVVGILSIVVRGLEMGIDFKGGTEIAVKFEKPIDITEIRSDLNKIGLGKVEVKTFGGETGVLVRTDLQEIPQDVFPKVQAEIEKAIDKFYPNIDNKVTETTTNSITYEFPNADTTTMLVDQLFTEGFQTSKASEEPENTKMVVRVGIADWIKIKFKETMKDNEFVVQKEDLVGPKVGEELKLDAIIAVALALLVILIYLGFRFKFVFATGAILATFHDVLITLGLFSLLYGLSDFLNLEISISIVAAFLTLVGYSVNDTVIVFDRIREYMKIHKTAPIEENINKAINRTMSRTVMTSFTTLIVVFVLFIGGGDVLRGFSFTLLFGILIGTYSSIFIASAYVYSYATKKAKKIQF